MPLHGVMILLTKSLIDRRLLNFAGSVFNRRSFEAVV